MHIPQLLATAVAVSLVTTACSREEARQHAREAASDARAAADRAGDQLADSWLTTKIQAQYFADEDIKARDIHVATREGIVALTGSVNDQRAREQAVQIARNTDGVREVQDRLTVGPAPSGAFDTAAGAVGPETATSGANANANASAEPAAGGTATASGAVPTTGTGIPEAARTVLVPVDDASVESRIQAKYFLDDSVKARRIEVHAQNGVVTLRGEVASEAERAQALLLARTTVGVERVEDSLTVNAAPATEVLPPIVQP